MSSTPVLGRPAHSRYGVYAHYGWPPPLSRFELDSSESSEEEEPCPRAGMAAAASSPCLLEQKAFCLASRGTTLSGGAPWFGFGFGLGIRLGIGLGLGLGLG